MNLVLRPFYDWIKKLKKLNNVFDECPVERRPNRLESESKMIKNKII